MVDSPVVHRLRGRIVKPQLGEDNKTSKRRRRKGRKMPGNEEPVTSSQAQEEILDSKPEILGSKNGESEMMGEGNRGKGDSPPLKTRKCKQRPLRLSPEE